MKRRGSTCMLYLFWDHALTPIFKSRCGNFESGCVRAHLFTSFLRDYAAVPPKRPDVVFSINHQHISRSLFIAEVKTPTATVQSRAKEVGRLIRRGVEILKADVNNFDHGGQAPTMLLARIDGFDVTVYELSLWQKLFMCQQIGSCSLPRAFLESSVDDFCKAILFSASVMEGTSTFLPAITLYTPKKRSETASLTNQEALMLFLQLSGQDRTLVTISDYGVAFRLLTQLKSVFARPSPKNPQLTAPYSSSPLQLHT
ncbi:hypothetical protein DFS34DRAFT_593705 [Phlyctochytrium arcticum]|nr:hypothetical protein DFS34DRAFT_593705 [Phlyctochytrium arcticum]